MTPAAPSDPPVDPPNPRRRILAAAAFGVFAAGVLLAAAFPVGVNRNGDGWEYWLTAEALARHASPDIRPDDEASVLDRFPPDDGNHTDGPGQWASGTAVSPAGRKHSIHCWLYPLSAVPANRLLAWCGGNRSADLYLTNAAWFVLAVGFALFRTTGPPVRRVAFAALACVNPAVWYIAFTGGEAYSWALVTISVALLDGGRYGRSALAAGLAAAQNPPLVLVAGVPVLAALVKREWKSAAVAAAGAATAFLPTAFNLIVFHKPTLIGDYTSPKYISVGRTLSLLFDLNQGLLPYVPVLLAAAAVGAVVLVRRRDVRGILLLLAVAGMMVGVQVQVNWNSDCRGMMRYLVWMLPALAWVATEGLGRRGRLVAAVAAVLVQGAILRFDTPSVWNYVEQRPLPRWVLTHAPWLYNPEREIFTERQVVGEAGDEYLPVGFGKLKGDVTKMLVSRASRDRIPELFDVDSDYLPTLLAAADAADTPAYVNPPKGAVRTRLDPRLITGKYDDFENWQADRRATGLPTERPR